MESILVAMVRDNLLNLPSYQLPEGYSYRFYSGMDFLAWADLEVAVGEFDNTESALTHFLKEFGSLESELQERCIFLEHKDQTIGTAMAWYNRGEFIDKYDGVLHWVAIHPDYQDRKLAKPLVSLAMEKLAELGHTNAFLASHTESFKAINMYYKHFGFKPFKDYSAVGKLAENLGLPQQDFDKGWEMLSKELGMDF